MMSEEEESFCRLCAEPTAVSQLIAPDGVVGMNSKIATKMLWINIDVFTRNSLPNAICFSCFDLLERTWSFLNNVRAAQTKLNDIFFKKAESENSSSDVKTDPESTGKPVNEDWEDFESLKQDVKPDILNDQLQLTTVDPRFLIDVDVVKTEKDSNDDDDYRPESNGFSTTDSDVPLYQVTKKKKLKKNKKLVFNSDVSDSILNSTKKYTPLTWEDFVCICGECDAQCDNFISLRLHSLQIHSRCCTFKCSVCGFIKTSYRSFLNHVKMHNKFLRHCCDYCNKSFVNTSHLKNHIIHQHAEEIKLTCRKCGSTFEDSEELNDHRVIYSESNRKRKRSRTSKEKEKEENSENENSIKKEDDIHNNKKQEKHNRSQNKRHEVPDLNEILKCDICDREFKTRGHLKTHQLQHTERKRNFSCHICGKTFFTKGTLTTHIFTHEDTKPFKCEFCPQTFKARGNLQAHISLHSNMKPFVCEQCGKSFRAKRHLKSHSIVHTDLMPFVCHFCKKPFRFKTRLNLHLRQHTGVKPYKCVYCQRDFTNGSNYKKHMKRKHNIDTSRKKYNPIIVSEEVLEVSSKV